MKGNVMPVIGNNPIFMPMLMVAWTASIVAEIKQKYLAAGCVAK